MIFNRQPDALKAHGRIESLKHDLRLLQSKLDGAPLWMPGVSLKKQCDQAVRMISDIGERFDRKLVVTIIGPSGSGKSTLLNALAGVDNLSEVGHQRPTTGHLIVFSDNGEDARLLSESLGNESVEIRSGYAAVFPEHVILIDTPDTDSTALQKHIPILRRAIAHSDMLICVFDAENPKRRDHVDFLAPFVHRFHGESLIGVMNKCDRLNEPELKNHILPDFENYIRTAWQGSVDGVLCISARRHLHDPKWDESAGPKHDFDRFEDLKKLIFDTINHAGYVVDRRLENARTLRDYVFTETSREISKDIAALETAEQQLRNAEKHALVDAISAMKGDDSRQLVGMNVMVYQKLSQMWLGPVGWMIAIWARLLIFGSGIVSMFRFGRPFQQVLGMISAFRHFKDSKSAMEEPHKTERVDAGLRNYRLVTMQRWPDIAESLVKGRFNAAVRDIEDALAGSELFSEKLSAIWSEALGTEIERVTRRLSGLTLQLLFNAPGVGILGYAGWLTLRGFFNGSYLSADFFLHAFFVIGIVLLLSFFLLQICIRLTANAGRITAGAFKKMKAQIDPLNAVIMNPVRSQLEVIMDLAKSNASDSE
jgi:energy-coupling factor transporter ATP-binding protein EcfA2